MAVTRIWPIQNNIHQVVSYAANKSKTDLSKYPDLIDALHYAGDKEKTNLENEKKLLVEGINCDPDIAARQMIDTKEIYGKTDGVVAYHAYISFKPGEVSPEEAQQVAMKVANKMWGKDYEMIVATHLNANCVHCHIVINSVSMTDGRKMNEDKAMYQLFRKTSDEVCLEHGLSVIKNPKGKRIPYNIYKAMQKGIKTKYDYMRDDINYAVMRSANEKQFFRILTQKGYWFDNGKIAYRNDEHAVNLSTFGDDYTYEKIKERIYTQDKFTANNNFRNYLYANDFLKRQIFVFDYKGYEFKESRECYRHPETFNRMVSDFTKMIIGGAVLGAPVISLLFLALLFAGAIAERNNCNPHPFTPKMKYSTPRIEFMQDQIDLAINEKLYDFAEVDKFILRTDTRIEELKSQRNKIYNQIRRCKDPTDKETLVARRDSFTAEIGELREKLKLAKRIIKDSPALEEKLKTEKQLIREWYFPERQRDKEKNYEER
ncbi:MAG: relaxase/mobilization nuclease domain-containing protein [Clostridia bacterium]|nr:relaxase/mobilization nuclease domain-containing protein [Clostridia bacterium]